MSGFTYLLMRIGPSGRHPMLSRRGPVLRSGFLAVLNILVLGAPFVIYVLFLTSCGRRVDTEELAKIQKVAIISFSCSPRIGYNHFDETEYRREVEFAKALCAYHFSVWRAMAASNRSNTIETDAAIESPRYKELAGKTEILYDSVWDRDRLESLSGDNGLWIITPEDASRHAWLAEALSVDAVLVVSSEYSFDVEPVAQKPRWTAVVTTKAVLVNRGGKIVLETSEARGESPEVRADEGFNIFVFQMSSIPRGSLAPMFGYAIAENWRTFSASFEADLSASKKPH
jgi:hypothetical protein